MDLEQFNKDVGFMMQALREAQAAADEGEVPVGCVIVGADGSVIARAHNLTELLKDPTAHAEMQAITAATAHIGAKYLVDSTLYVTVEPCPMCAAAMFWAQLKRVVYGCKDPKRGASGYTPSLYHPKTQVVGGVLEKECSGMMTAFFKQRREEETKGKSLK